MNLDRTSFRPTSPKRFRTVSYLAFLSLSWFPLCAFHKSFRTKALNQLVLFLDSPFIQLAAAVNKVLMSSSAILLSQCFLVEVPFFEGFLQRQKKKNFFLREWLNMTGLPTFNHWLWDAPRWLRSLTPALFLPYTQRIIKKIRGIAVCLLKYFYMQWYLCVNMFLIIRNSSFACCYQHFFALLQNKKSNIWQEFSAAILKNWTCSFIFLYLTGNGNFSRIHQNHLWHFLYRNLFLLFCFHPLQFTRCTQAACMSIAFLILSSRWL